MSEEKIISIFEKISAEYENKPASVSDFEWFKSNIKNSIVESYYDELQGEQKENKLNEIMKSLIIGIIAFKKIGNIDAIKSSKTAGPGKGMDKNAQDFWDDAEEALKELSLR